jgi:hypothetical protein
MTLYVQYMDVELVKKFGVWGNRGKTVHVERNMIQYKNSKKIVDTTNHSLAKLSALFSYS